MNNISEIAAIKIKGGVFQPESVSDGRDTLEIFVHENLSNNQSNRSVTQSAIIYGKNGTGKSTISKAFMKAKGEIVDTIDAVAFYNLGGEVITLSPEEKKKIVVFNEDFIDKNIKIDADGLGSIVMLGQEQIEEQSKIDALKKDIKAKRAEKDEKGKELDNLKNVENSPIVILKEIHGELANKEGNFLKRNSTFDGARSYTDKLRDEFEGIIKNRVTENVSDLWSEYNSKLEEYRRNKSGENTIEVIASKISLSYDAETEQEILDLLANEIEEEKSDELGEWIVSLGNDKAEALKKELENPEIECCPHCHKEWEVEYKKLLATAIDRFLNNPQGKLLSGLEEKIKLIGDLQSQVESIPISEYEYDDVPMYSECNALINIVKSKLEGVLDKLEEKKNAIFIRVDMDKTSIAETMNHLNEALDELEKEKGEHNKKANNTSALKKELQKLSIKIAYYENESKIKDYNSKCKAISDKEEEVRLIKSELAKLEQSLQEINERAKEHKKDIAVGFINEYLKFVFCSKKRIQIEYDETHDTYRLKSRGTIIGPKQASIGERNIIALCYFFASILQNKSVENAYSDRYLFIIDDPVSSFDSGNKIGLVSFLKRMMNEYLTGNKETRILITTHDLKTALDFNVVLNELHNKYSDFYWNFLELKELHLHIFDENQNEYSKMMTLIYQFAQNPSENDVYAIAMGNMMRRVLEAYGTFTYGMGMADLSTNDKILTRIKDENLRKYFENSMYRLFLNGASHTKGSINELGDNLFFPEFDEEEVVQVAKDTICLLYMLNPRHVLSNVKILDRIGWKGKKIYKSESDIAPVIKAWIKSIS